MYSLTLCLWMTEQKTYLEPVRLTVQLDMRPFAFGEVCFLPDEINCDCLCTVFQSYSINFMWLLFYKKKKKVQNKKVLEPIAQEAKLEIKS